MESVQADSANPVRLFSGVVEGVKAGDNLYQFPTEVSGSLIPVALNDAREGPPRRIYSYEVIEVTAVAAQGAPVVSLKVGIQGVTLSDRYLGTQRAVDSVSAVAVVWSYDIGGARDEIQTIECYVDSDNDGVPEFDEESDTTITTTYAGGGPADGRFELTALAPSWILLLDDTVGAVVPVAVTRTTTNGCDGAVSTSQSNIEFDVRAILPKFQIDPVTYDIRAGSTTIGEYAVQWNGAKLTPAYDATTASSLTPAGRDQPRRRFPLATRADTKLRDQRREAILRAAVLLRRTVIWLSPVGWVLAGGWAARFAWCALQEVRRRGLGEVHCAFVSGWIAREAARDEYAETPYEMSCHECGYRLAPVPTARCPECGCYVELVRR